MNKTITILDGALGTSLWDMTEDKSPVWKFNLTNPDIVLNLHREFINAGSNIICANTFGANRMSLKGEEYSVSEVATAAVEIAKKAVGDTDVLIACDVGPLTELLEPYGDLTTEDAYEIYTEQIDACMKAGADIIFLQTFMDIEMLKIAAKVASNYDVPLFCSMSFMEIGKTMMGNSVLDMIEELKEFNVAAIGMNCSLEPEKSLAIIKEFRANTNLPIIFKPNAGLPKFKDGLSTSGTDEEDFAKDVIKAADLGEIYIGGCCGTPPSYIKRMVMMLEE